MVTIKPLSFRGVLKRYGFDDEGGMLFGRTYLWILKTVDPDFPDPIRPGARGSRLLFDATAIDQYFAKRMKDLPTYASLLKQHQQTVSDSAATVRELVTSAIDSPIKISTRTKSVVITVESDADRDAVESVLMEIEDMPQLAGWGFTIKCDSGSSDQEHPAAADRPTAKEGTINDNLT